MSGDDAAEAPYVFECVDCGERTESGSARHSGDCPACGGELKSAGESAAE